VCVRQAFGSQFALFVETSESRRLYPNPDADLVADDWQAQLEFLGLMVGKALYESILIELPLASFFLGRLLGRVMQFDDLRSLDDELYRNLLWMKRASAAEIEALELDFTATRTAFGREQSVPLCAGGEQDRRDQGELHALRAPDGAPSARDADSRANGGV
jgi:ubiquitin-protein ligase E3 C